MSLFKITQNIFLLFYVTMHPMVAASKSMCPYILACQRNPLFCNPPQHTPCLTSCTKSVHVTSFAFDLTHDYPGVLEWAPCVLARTIYFSLDSLCLGQIPCLGGTCLDLPVVSATQDSTEAGDSRLRKSLSWVFRGVRIVQSPEQGQRNHGKHTH